jgi:hypothetical protein
MHDTLPTMRLRLTALLVLTLTACSNEISSEAVEEPEAPAQTAATNQALGTTGCACALPTSGLYATFRVGSESFKQQITTASAMADALALWRGKSNKRIPIGKLACSCVGWNCQWNFQIRPETLQMASFAIEVCDGIPSYVNANCPTFGGGSYCPWNAQLVELRDCRWNRACPLVPR